MKKSLVRSLALLILILAVIAIDGCSVIGLGIGVVSDSRKPDSLMIPCCQVPTIQQGREIKVVLLESEPVRGTFVGLGSIPADDYAQRYSRYRKGNRVDVLVPALGERVEITLKSRVSGERELVGFDYKYLVKKPERKPEPEAIGCSPSMVVRQESDTSLGMVPLSDVDQVKDADGNIIKGEMLERMATSGQLPLLSSLAIADFSGQKYLPMEEVSRVELKNKKNDKWKALAAGALIDSILILSFLSAMDNLFEGMWGE
jgi:hypothetical protein